MSNENPLISTSIGITALAYQLPDRQVSLDELETGGKIVSAGRLLREFGFENCRVEEDTANLEELIFASGRQVLEKSKSSPKSIANLFLYSGTNMHYDEFRPKNENETLRMFRYPVAQLRHRLGLTKANALGISQQGCSGLFSAIQFASDILQNPAQGKILCLAGDHLPPGSPREIMYNVMSDGAAALLIEQNASRNRVIYYYQHVQSYYWDTPLHREELMAAYFPLSQRVISGCLEQSGLKMSDIRWIVPHNVSLRSWKILAQLLSIPMERIWTKNISRIGHTVCCDHVINLVDMEKEGVLNPGDYLLLFTFGFGASWSCLILQH